MTYPDLQVVSGGLGEGLAEPGRVVEGATGTAGITASTIPQRVIGVGLISNRTFLAVPRVAKIITADERFKQLRGKWPLAITTAVAK